MTNGHSLPQFNSFNSGPTVVFKSKQSWKMTSNFSCYFFFHETVFGSYQRLFRASLVQGVTLDWSAWQNIVQEYAMLIHWGRVNHICVSELTIIVPDNGLSPGRRQAIIWTNDGILLIGPLGTNFSEIYSEFQHFHSTKCTWKFRLRNGVHFFSAPMC